MRPALALVLALLIFGCQDALPPGAARAVLHVEGMTCEGCESGVKAALERLEGVREAEVSHKRSRTSVVYDPSKVGPRELLAAVESVGYKASLEQRQSVEPTPAR